MARRVKDNVGHILYYIFDIVFDGIFGRPYVAGGVTQKPPLQGPELGIMSHDPFHRRCPGSVGDSHRSGSLATRLPSVLGDRRDTKSQSSRQGP